MKPLKYARSFGKDELLQGLSFIELLTLAVTGFATTAAIGIEIYTMVSAQTVTLADLLLMFLYLEVLVMIGQYLETGRIQVRFPIYIAIVALARYLIIDAKDLSYVKILSVSGAILLLTFSVLVIRFGHARYPYITDYNRADHAKNDEDKDLL